MISNYCCINYQTHILTKYLYIISHCKIGMKNQGETNIFLNHLTACSTLLPKLVIRLREKKNLQMHVPLLSTRVCLLQPSQDNGGIKKCREMTNLNKTTNWIIHFCYCIAPNLKLLMRINIKIIKNERSSNFNKILLKK